MISNFTHTHTHTLLSNILLSIPPVPYSLPDHSVQVHVLQITCQTHFGSKLALSTSAATYMSGRFSCAMFWYAFVTKDCQQSQSSFELMWKEWRDIATAQLHHLALYTCTWHTLVLYCLQSKLPTHESANITVHCTRTEKTVTIQACQYRYPSSNSDWLVHNEL